MKIVLQILLYSTMLFINNPADIDSTENILDRIDSPGSHYILFDHERIIHEEKRGYSNLSLGTHLQNNTRFRIYSITKTFTALAILQLCQKGYLELDDPAALYITDFPFDKSITIRHLLSHSSGIRNPIPLNWIHLPSEHEEFKPDTFFKSVMDNNSNLKAKPGEKYSYSNLGYYLLGEVIEQVSGLPYETYIKTNIFSNLNCQNIGFELEDQIDATGYQKRWSIMNFMLGMMIERVQFMEKPKGNWVAFKPLIPNGTAYGGILSDAPSLMNFIQLILSGEHLIEDDYKSIWFEPQELNSHSNSEMALGWFVGDMQGMRYLTHAGGGGGFYSEIRIYPEQKMGSLLLTNQSGFTDRRLLDQLDSNFINSFLGKMKK